MWLIHTESGPGYYYYAEIKRRAMIAAILGLVLLAVAYVDRDRGKSPRPGESALERTSRLGYRTGVVVMAIGGFAFVVVGTIDLLR